MRIISPLMIIMLLAGCVGAPDRQDRASRGQSTIPTSPAARQCLAELGAAQARFSPLPDRQTGRGCGLSNTVQLDGLAGDRSTLALANLGPVTCPMAQKFAGWARFGAGRAAEQILGSRLVTIETMGSYNCRNVAGSSRRSGHASANAIDVSAFVLADGRRISLTDGWRGTAAERQFLRVVHESACKRFGTVLGPEYNAQHRDHFHLEASNSSFCR